MKPSKGRKDTRRQTIGLLAGSAGLLAANPVVRARCYGKAGAAERQRCPLYDAPHEFNLEMQAEAWKWLKRWD